MSKILLVVELRAKPESKERLLKLISAIGESAQTEAGTLSFTIGTSPQDNVVWLSECYRDQAALEHHRQSDAFQAMVSEIGDLLAAPFSMAEVPVAFDLAR